MESKLIYVSDKEYYNLEDDKGNLIATSSPLKDSPIYELSIKNCIEVSGNINIIELAESWYFSDPKNVLGVNLKVIEGFKAGFNKAMELNKDKLFGVKEVVELCKILLSNPIEKCGKTYQELTDNYIQSLQKPKEIEVEIEMEYQGFEIDGKIRESYLPKIDENGCITLTKKK
jgi:hypothetical protein